MLGLLSQLNQYHIISSSCDIPQRPVLEISQELFVEQSVDGFLYEVCVEVEASLCEQGCGFLE
jgi:hypothetical protein